MQSLRAAGKELKEQLEAIDAKLAAVEIALQREGQRIPNLTHPAVPLGGEDACVMLRTVGAQRAFDFPVRDHVTLGEALDLVDFDSGSEVSDNGRMNCDDVLRLLFSTFRDSGGEFERP